MWAPILALPNFSKSSVLETDASNTRVGTILSQNHHPISFSKKSYSHCNCYELMLDNSMPSLSLLQNSNRIGFK